MKKLMAILLTLIMALSAIPVMAEDNVTVILDGEVIDCRNAQGVEVPPILVNGTTYLPVRAIANALNLDVQWDNATKSVFINGVSVLAKKTDVINIFINGGKFTAKDANGNVVNPILQDGTTYLPVRAIGEAFDKEVAWDGTTKTVTLTTKQAPVIVATVINKDKVYSLINKETGNALTATDHNTLEYTAPKDGELSQLFRFVPAPTDGFFFIQSISNGQNFDVSGHSVEAGGEIITWDATGAENQMFTIKDVEGGTLIYSASSGLPVQATATNTIQSSLTRNAIQLWEIKEMAMPEGANVPQSGAYRIFSIGDLKLTDNNGLLVTTGDIPNNQKWTLTDAGNGEYFITNLATGMNLDVNGQSLTPGDPIITWYAGTDPNQRWILEKQSDDTYLIKSVHSSLYLTINSNNMLVQDYKNSAYNQNWKMTQTN
ncbi:MAG: RICIN domain-containing protein [Clostridia bacterium]|nr:RICIN domain-containing protein [Clostridia bacterium]